VGTLQYQLMIKKQSQKIWNGTLCVNYDIISFTYFKRNLRNVNERVMQKISLYILLVNLEFHEVHCNMSKPWTFFFFSCWVVIWYSSGIAYSEGLCLSGRWWQLQRKTPDDNNRWQPQVTTPDDTHKLQSHMTTPKLGCHRVFSSGLSSSEECCLPGRHLELSHGLLLGLLSGLSPRVVAGGCHLGLSPGVVTWGCHLGLSPGVVTWGCHLWLSPRVVQA
jgi:hypothetical protein